MKIQTEEKLQNKSDKKTIEIYSKRQWQLRIMQETAKSSYTYTESC